jgi:hypothetical protein
VKDLYVSSFMEFVIELLEILRVMCVFRLSMSILGELFFAVQRSKHVRAEVHSSLQTVERYKQAESEPMTYHYIPHAHPLIFVRAAYRFLLQHARTR